MAGSVTVTSSKTGVYTKYSCALLSDASGVVSANAVSVKGGSLVQIVVTPDTGGTVPTTLFDLTLTLSGGGTDLMGGAGANLSETVQTVMGADVANLPIHIPPGSVIPVAANMGNAKGATVDLYFL